MTTGVKIMINRASFTTLVNTVEDYHEKTGLVILVFGIGYYLEIRAWDLVLPALCAGVTACFLQNEPPSSLHVIAA